MRVLSANILDFYTFEDLPLVLFDDDFNVVVGPNGTGKTALVLDALVWCLWGETTRGKGPKQGNVSFTLEQRAEVFTVERRKGGDVRLAGPSIRKHGVDGKGIAYEQFINGQTPTETQQKICDVFGTYERFCAERVFSRRLQAKFGSETDKGRKALIESILGMEQYERAAKIARKDLTAKQAELSLRREEMARLRGLVEGSQAFLARQDAEQEEALDALIAQREREAQALLAAEERYKATDSAREGASARLSSVVSTLEVVRRKAAEENRNIVLARERIRVLGLERAAITAQKVCPLCRTDVEAIDVRQLDQYYQDLRAEHEQALLYGEQRLQVYQAEATEMMGDRDRLQTEHTQKDGEFLGADQAHTALEKAYAATNLLLDRRQKEQERIEEERTRLAQTQEQLEGRERAVMALEAEIGEISFAVDVLGSKGARVLQMEGALARVTAAANRVLSILPQTEGARPISIELKTSREGARGDVDEIGIKVIGAGGGEYKGLSDGQQARVDIALMLGLATAGQSRGYLVFDEVFDSLDEAGVEAASELVKDLARARQVVLVSHNPRFLDRMPAGRRAWKVSLKNGVSEVTL